MSSQVIASTKNRARVLTEAEISEIEHEKTLYPDNQTVGLEALKIVQNHQGWVSDESLLAIAEYLDLSVADLEGVATFFNLIYRQPVGRNVILYCDSVSCWICRGGVARESPPLQKTEKSVTLVAQMLTSDSETHRSTRGAIT